MVIIRQVWILNIFYYNIYCGKDDYIAAGMIIKTDKMNNLEGQYRMLRINGGEIYPFANPTKMMQSKKYGKL